MKTNPWINVYEAALSGLADVFFDGHESGHGDQIGPVLGKVVWPEFASRYLSAAQPLDGHAVLGREPTLAGGPVRDISDVAIPEGASHCSWSAEVLVYPLGGGLQEIRVRIHASKSNLISRRGLFWLVLPMSGHG